MVVSRPRTLTESSARSPISTIEPSRSRRCGARAARGAHDLGLGHLGARLERAAPCPRRRAAARRSPTAPSARLPAGTPKKLRWTAKPATASASIAAAGERLAPVAARLRRRDASAGAPRQHREAAADRLLQRRAAGGALVQVVLDQQRARLVERAGPVRGQQPEHVGAAADRVDRGRRPASLARRAPHTRAPAASATPAGASSSRTAAIASSSVIWLLLLHGLPLQRTELLLQALPRPVQHHRHRDARDAQHLRDLVVAVPSR